MAEIKVSLLIDVKATLTLDEAECRVLDALIGYGTDSFLKVFYEKLGKVYLQPHEKAVRSLFHKFGETCGPALREAEQLRRQLSAGQKALAEKDKPAAGRLLDGKLHDAYPEGRA